MSLSVYRRLRRGPLEKPSATIEVAFGVKAEPLGITRDVPVSIGKYTFPVEFYVADYEPNPRVSIVLGRPFLATTGARMDFGTGKMELRVGDASLFFLTKYAYDESDEEEDDLWKLTKELDRTTTPNT